MNQCETVAEHGPKRAHEHARELADAGKHAQGAAAKEDALEHSRLLMSEMGWGLGSEPLQELG